VADGIIAALAWGLGAMAAAVAARQAGALAAVMASQVAGGCALACAAVALRPPSPAGPAGWLGAAAAGVAGAAGMLAYYMALERGSPSIVTAVTATYAAVTAALAATAGGERLAPGTLGGIALTLAGVIPMAAVPSRPGVRRRPRSPGPPARRTRWRRHGRHRGRGTGILLAAASSAAYGLSSFLLGGAAARGGWALSSLVFYEASVAALLAAAPFRLSRHAGPLAARGITWAAAAGLCEAAALAAIAGGGQAGHLAVTSAAAGLYPAVPLAAGRILGRERLALRQVAGIAIVTAGITLVSLG
jgi:drug/metabolite transporter (DMT)-like permease